MLRSRNVWVRATAGVDHVRDHTGGEHTLESLPVSVFARKILHRHPFRIEGGRAAVAACAVGQAAMLSRGDKMQKEIAGREAVTAKSHSGSRKVVSTHGVRSRLRTRVPMARRVARSPLISRWVMATLLVAIGMGTTGHATIAFGEDPRLVLDAGGHTALVRKVLFTPDGQKLITVSEDKTIRFWDIATGEPLHVLRPPSGESGDGMLFAAAISPDGKTLAVSGLSYDDADPSISLISIADERIIRSLKGHEFQILDLAFSANGRWLISGGGDNTARIWDVDTGATMQTLRGHSREVYGVVFSPDDQQCATASNDRTAAIWSVSSGRRVATLEGHTEQLFSVDWSPDGRLLVTGASDDTVRFWTSAGQFLRSARGPASRDMKVTRFHPDSRQVAIGQVGNPFGPGSGIIDSSNGVLRTLTADRTHGVFDVRFAPDGRQMAFAQATRHELLLRRTSDGEIVQTFVGRGRIAESAGWSSDGTSVAWREKTDTEGANVVTPPMRAFDLTELSFRNPVGAADVSNWHFAETDRGNTRLDFSETSAVDVLRNDQKIATLQPADDFSRLYDTVFCATFLTRNRVAVGGNFKLRLYHSENGTVQRECVGHSGSVWSVSPSLNGRYLLSTSDDMTLRVWNLEDEGNEPLEPLVSLFFAGEDWVAWTPQGYYAASPGGERLMGWQVNNGPNQLASFYPAVRFRKQFYRPDVIKLLLQTGSVAGALEAAGSSGELTTVRENLPPRVEILSPQSAHSSTASEEITIRIQATQTGRHPVTELQLLVDGRPLDGRGGIVRLDEPQQSVTHSFHVPLIPGVEHSIQARADNGVSYGLSKEILVSYESPNTETRLPSLYVLAIGVSDYHQQDLQLTYADDDARRLADTFTQRAAGLYAKVETNVVVDKDASRRGILTGLSWLKKQMTQHDVGVLFYSGHGAKDEVGDFYLLPCDVDTHEPLALSGVPDAQVKSLLQSTPGRLIVMLDACHAGSLGGDRRKNSTALTDDLVRDLANDDYGIVIMASSTGREFSLESPDNQNGMFTLALCEGLEGRADSNHDSHIYFNELDLYVTERVKQLTDGKQHPVTAKPTTIRSFPLTSDR